MIFSRNGFVRILRHSTLEKARLQDWDGRLCGRRSEKLHPFIGLPAEVEVRWLTRPASGMNFVHLFATDASRLMTRLKSCREKMAPDAVVWISWPKKTSGVASDLTEDLIREMVLPTGLVDIKVCAVDEVWSGLKFMIRKELR
jgi:hypothetical protein